MPKHNEINELSEILATALSGRPDLQNRLGTLLGPGPKNPVPEVKKITHEQRKENVRRMFSALNLREKIKHLNHVIQPAS